MTNPRKVTHLVPSLRIISLTLKTDAAKIEQINGNHSLIPAMKTLMKMNTLSMLRFLG